MRAEVLLSLLVTLAALPLSLGARPQPRNYDTHHYYSLETPGITSQDQARGLAHSIGAEFVERIGELDGHWLVRSEKDSLATRNLRASTEDEHHVLKRWKTLNSKRSPENSSGGIKSVRHLPVKQRAKRHNAFQKSLQHRGLTPKWIPGPTAEATIDDTELLFAQNQLNYHDPLLSSQWHLINTQMPEVELNVTGLWNRKIDGRGVVVAIIDDGLDFESDDLAGNFYPDGSYDFNDHDPLPKPRLSDDQHGTRCAGEIAAIPNDVCGVGVSHKAHISGIRILSAPISDADEAAALNYEYQKNEIYSCSWGPPDDGKSMEAPEELILKAIVNGVQKGRGGKGSIFVFAAGNGGGLDDQCNFDGYTNSIFSLTIGAVDRKGLHPYYSEMCAAMLAVAPSSGSGDHIHTTDVGKDKCTDSHGGTSAAAPLAGGVVALALQVRPQLTWRDMQHIMVNTAVHFSPEDPDWEKTASGRYFSYKYGYGRIDAGLVVEAAESWKLVKPQAWVDSPAIFLGEIATETGDDDTERRSNLRERQLDEGVAEPETTQADINLGEEADTTEPTQTTDEDSPIVTEPVQQGLLITENGIESSYEITQEMLTDLNFESLEHITVRVWIDHQKRGDVEVELTSPSGIVSVLARQRRFDDANTGFNGWKFMSMKHWGEDPVGIWKINVKDNVNPDKIGYFKSWSLQLWGETINAKEAKVWSPADNDASDEEQLGSEPTGTGKVSQKPKPTDHLPDDHGSADGEAHLPGLGNTSPTSAADIATGPGAEDAEVDDEGNISYGSDTWYNSSVGAIKDNKTYAGGALGIFMLAIMSGIVFFIFRSRRKRMMMEELSRERGEYVPVAEEVPMGILERGRRKLSGTEGDPGKDLYNAFDEVDLEDDQDEHTALRYHDEFLEDEDHQMDESGQVTPMYKDAREQASVPGSSSTSSWQDAESHSASRTSPA